MSAENKQDTNENPSPRKACLARISLDVRQLGTKFPPRIFATNKQLLYELACPKGVESLSEVLTFSRWSSTSLPASFSRNASTTKFSTEQNVYPYGNSEDGNVDFWVNFADKHLFGFYGGELFAQDELQVGEHPGLMVLTEFLSDFERRNKVASNKLIPYTMSGHTPTPCIVMNVERMCAVKLDRNAAEGRPRGLYGNNFARASREALLHGVVPLQPPTKSNIIAMAALGHRFGSYSRSQVQFTLDTAYTAFNSARFEAYYSTGYLNKDTSEVENSERKPRVVIHTGNWGTGAFGGNKVIMALLQMTAAHMAGIDELVYHTVSRDGTEAYNIAEKVFNELLQNKEESAAGSAGDDALRSTDKFIGDVVGKKFRWGVSNGT